MSSPILFPLKYFRLRNLHLLKAVEHVKNVQYVLPSKRHEKNGHRTDGKLTTSRYTTECEEKKLGRPVVELNPI